MEAKETTATLFWFTTYNPGTDSFSAPVEIYGTLEAAINGAKTRGAQNAYTAVFDDKHDSPRWTSF
jgi:hypothetical protein